ncbi:hypothetical protein D9M71_520500 [compost metagenome]
MGQGGIAEQIIGKAIAQVEQARGAEGVLVQITRVVSPHPALTDSGRSTANSSTADGGCAIDPGAFLFIGATDTGGEVQALGQVPGALAEQGKAVGLDMALAERGDIGQGTSRGAIPDIRLGAVIDERFVIQIGAEVIGAQYVVKEATGG